MELEVSMELLLGVGISILDLGEFSCKTDEMEGRHVRVRCELVSTSESRSWTTAGVVLDSGVGQVVLQGGLGLAGGSET